LEDSSHGYLLIYFIERKPENYNQPNTLLNISNASHGAFFLHEISTLKFNLNNHSHLKNNGKLAIQFIND